MLGCMTRPFTKTEERVKLDFQIWIKINYMYMEFKALLAMVAERTLLRAGCEFNLSLFPELAEQFL